MHKCLILCGPQRVALTRYFAPCFSGTKELHCTSGAFKLHYMCSLNVIRWILNFTFRIQKGVLTMQSTVQTSAMASWKQAAYVWLKALTYLTLFVLLYAFALQAFAGAPATGGTGASAVAQTRVTTVANSFLAILIAVGAVLIAGAFCYVGYGMAYNAKRWSDVANVFFGALIAGMGSMMAAWLFS
jgi:hypothetical protein